MLRCRPLRRPPARKASSWPCTGGRIGVCPLPCPNPFFCWSVGPSVSRSVGWCFDWSVDKLNGWLFGSLFRLLVVRFGCRWYRLVGGWLVGWLIGWMVTWFIYWLVEWLINWLVSWLSGWLTCKLISLLIGEIWHYQYMERCLQSSNLSSGVSVTWNNEGMT